MVLFLGTQKTNVGSCWVKEKASAMLAMCYDAFNNSTIAPLCL